MADDTSLRTAPPRVGQPHGTSPSVNVASSTRFGGALPCPRSLQSRRTTGCDVIGGRAPHSPRLDPHSPSAVVFAAGAPGRAKLIAQTRPAFVSLFVQAAPAGES